MEKTQTNDGITSFESQASPPFPNSSPLTQETTKFGVQRSVDMTKQKSTLPPCLVCGGASSGVHFGAITCESCKVFYRRSLLRKSDYVCYKSGDCIINTKNRSHCTSCRFNKCLDVGMSKSGVKKGRYSLAKKQDIQKVALKMENEAKLKTEEKERQKQIHQEVITDTIQRLKKSHDKHQMITPEVWAKAKKGQLLNQITTEAIQAGMDLLPPEEIHEFYKKTGIDLSGFISLVKPCAQYCSFKMASDFLDYLNSLKEFMDLSDADRIITLKGAAIIWMFVSTYQIFNTDDFTMSCVYCGICYTEAHHRLFETFDDYREFFKPLRRLKVLNLTEDETAMLRAFVVFDTSQNMEEVSEAYKISSAQNLYLEGLLEVLEINRGKENATKVYTKIIDFITSFRLHSHGMRQKFEKNTEYPDYPEFSKEVKYSRIAGEVFSFPEHFIDDLGNELNSLQLD